MKLHAIDLSHDVVHALMTELRDQRAALHRSHRVTCCDMQLVMPGLRFGARTTPLAVPATGLLLAGECVCRDLVADVLYLVTTFVTEHGANMDNLAGAVRVHVRMRVVDVMRSYRAAQGAQVKPKQVRQNRFGRALPDDEHRAVLGHLADEAGYTAPLPGQGYLLRRLAERCVAEFGNSVPYYLERLPAIMSTVKRVCSAGARVNIGTRSAPEYVSWYDAYIDRPLGRRPDAGAESLSHDDDHVRSADQVADPSADLAFVTVDVAQAVGLAVLGRTDPDSVIVDMIVADVGAVPHADQDRTLRVTIRTLVDCGLLPKDHAEALLVDPDRVHTVLSRVRDVIDAPRRTA
jgi:hypothetical protein